MIDIEFFFGDDTSTGVYEPLPYLTVVNGETFDCFNEVDILYNKSCTNG